MDKSVKNQVKEVIKGIIFLNIVIILTLLICSKISLNRDTLMGSVLNLNIATILGLIIGSIVSIFNFYMLASSTENMVNQVGKTMVQLKFAGGYFLRFAIYAVVLLLAAKLDFISMFTAAIGLLSTQIVLLVQKMTAIFRRKEE